MPSASPPNFHSVRFSLRHTTLAAVAALAALILAACGSGSTTGSSTLTTTLPSTSASTSSTHTGAGTSTKAGSGAKAGKGKGRGKGKGKGDGSSGSKVGSGAGSGTGSANPVGNGTISGSGPNTPLGGHRNSLISIVEDDHYAGTEPGSALPDYKAVGAQVMRYNVNWAYIVKDSSSLTKPKSFNQASPSGSEYNFAQLDTVAFYAAQNNIKLYLTLTAPAPRWAAGNPPAKVEAVCKASNCQQYMPSAIQYKQFVEAVGKRYSGHYTPPGASSPLPRVSFWSIWNEPNYGPNLNPQSEKNGAGQIVDTAAPQYRKLVEAGWQGLAATGHTTKTDTILIGETAPRGESNPGIDNMTPTLQFIRDLYCVNGSYQPLTGSVATALGCPTSGSSTSFASENPALFDATGWADHPYPDGVDPAVKAGSGGPTNEWADFARLGNLASGLDKVTAAWGNDEKMAIYNTEFGYFTNPPGNHPDSLSLPLTARYDNEAEYLSWKDPQIRSYDQYLLRDPSKASGSVFDTGLEFASGKAKEPVMDAYRLPLWLPQSTSSSHSLEVWGCARPALQSGTSKQVAIQFKGASGGFKTVSTASIDLGAGGCYFDTKVTFPSSGTVRLAYHDGSKTLVSRTQAITLN